MRLRRKPLPDSRPYATVPPSYLYEKRMRLEYLLNKASSGELRGHNRPLPQPARDDRELVAYRQQLRADYNAVWLEMNYREHHKVCTWRSAKAQWQAENSPDKAQASVAVQQNLRAWRESSKRLPNQPEGDQ